MAHSLALKTIAEGVETVQIADALKAYGCDEAQLLLRAPYASKRVNELFAPAFWCRCSEESTAA
jgi:EAL domain-containing protein (putative c-di-GMP-specific phosphodiesterase class I)